MTFEAYGEPLVLFSAPHITAIAVILALCAVFVLFRNKLKNEAVSRRLAVIMAAFTAAMQLVLYIFYTYNGLWSVSWNLPLHLCDISVFLTIAVLLTKNIYLSELLYFWGMGGAVQAILTPDLGSYSYPHFVFFHFFSSHGMIVLACLFIIFAHGFRPVLKSVVRAFIITNAYAALIIPVNVLTGGNYLFLRYKPQSGSIMDLLGPWPWYILGLEGLAVIMFILLYLPFGIKEFKAVRHDRTIPF